MTRQDRYAPATASVLIDAIEVAAMFGKSKHWIQRHRVRMRLYKKGFPHPVERGRWSRLVVQQWFEMAGRNLERVPPARNKRAVRTAPRHTNGYAPIISDT